MKIRYSRRALQQLDRIYENIESDNHQAAQEQKQLILDGLRKLEKLPELGKLTDEESVHKIVLGKGRYAAYYAIKRAIIIVRILHTRQNQ